MIASHLTPKWIFFRCTLSESLGRAPLCLRFLPRSTKKSPIWAKCALNHWFPILARIPESYASHKVNRKIYYGKDCFVIASAARQSPGQKPCPASSIEPSRDSGSLVQIPIDFSTCFADDGREAPVGLALLVFYFVTFLLQTIDKEGVCQRGPNYL